MRLMIFVLAASAAFSPLRAQPAVLESLRDAIVSRWEFQKRFPAAQKLFDNQATEGERMTMIGQLRPLATSATAAEAAASTPTPGNQSQPALSTMWANFALGLAAEKSRPGAGERDLEAAALQAKGNLGVNYELARILGEVGMYQRAHSWQMECHRTMLEKGYTRIPDLAKLELWKVRETIRQGKFQVARQGMEFAKRLDPFCPWVPYQNLLLHFAERSPLGWDLGFVWTSVGEILALMRYYEVQNIFLINLSRSLRLGLGIFGALGLLILFARHFARIAHPWAEKLPQVVEMRVRYLAIALVPLSLAVGGAGYVLLGLFGAMLLWKHCSRDEKSILKVILMGIALVPILVMWERSMCRHLDARLGVNLYHEAWSRGYERSLSERALSFPAHGHEDSVFRALAISLQYKKQGNYLRAGQYGREATRIDPQNPMALLNAGNLEMASFEYPKAAVAYEKARREAPHLVETWFNSSQAELYNNNSDKHKTYLDKAAELDPIWVTQWLKDNDQNFPVYPATRKAMDPMLRTGQAWSAAWRSLIDLDFLRVGIRAGILDIKGSWLLAAVILSALALYFRFRHYSLHTHGWDLFECKICGRVMCRSCRKGVHCQNCFKTVAGVHENRIRVDLVSRLRNRSALVSVRTVSTLNSLFPGIGHLYLGRGGGRFFWPLMASLLIGALWSVNHLFMEYPVFVIGPMRWLPVVPLAALYGIFNLKQLRTPVDVSDILSTQSAPERETVR
jgi:tetratricopeptide (TPR) repeat protein